MDLVFIGYFPKAIAVPPDFGAAHLRDVCSVSECIAKAPNDWIGHWLHNPNWIFSSPEAARRVCDDSSGRDYTILAYRILATEFDLGSARAARSLWPRPVGEGGFDPTEVETLPPHYRSLGFDAVSCSTGNSFECSPLSCNGGWQEFETNEHCLVDSLERAIELAEIFSKGNWEPGPYRVVEVLGPHPLSD